MSSTLQKSSDELISEEIREIISYRPHWMIRKGNLLFFLIIVFLLSFSFLIQYPDVITGSSRLVALNAPKLVGARQTGKLTRLLVASGQEVGVGQHLACMESTAAYEEVLTLERWIKLTTDAVYSGDYSKITAGELPVLTSLGDLQPQYQNFQNQYSLVEQVFDNGYYKKKSASLKKDLAYLKVLKNVTSNQATLVQKDQQLKNIEYNAYETLANQKVIAPLELNQYKSKLIAAQQQSEQIKSQATAHQMTILGKEKELLDLEKQIADEKQRFYSALLDLKSSIEKWIQQYVLVAPVAGKVLFSSNLEEGELIQNAQTLFFIQPYQTTYYAEVMAGQSRLGKLKEGQKVVLKVNSFPSDEFGYITGVLAHISEVPASKDSFLLTVTLPYGLKTSYNKRIVFRNNLSAHAEIITDNRKLSDRLLGPLRKIFDR